MATQIREVFTASGMSLTIFCGGMSYVGVRIAGTWAGTLAFEASIDGVNFVPIYVTPFPSGTAVLTTTANGNWFLQVGNFIAFRVRQTTFTSGSVTVAIATSQDSSYQDAYLGSSTVFVNSESSSGVNTLTQAAQANRAWTVNSLEISTSGPMWGGGQASVTIYDGSISGTVLNKQYLEEATGSVGHRYDITLPAGGITGTPGNAMTIVCRIPGSSVTSEINAKFSAGGP